MNLSEALAFALSVKRKRVIANLRVTKLELEEMLGSAGQHGVGAGSGVTDALRHTKAALKALGEVV